MIVLLSVVKSSTGKVLIMYKIKHSNKTTGMCILKVFAHHNKTQCKLHTEKKQTIKKQQATYWKN